MSDGMPYPRQKLTYRVRLPGGQKRLREAALYVAQKAQVLERFGLVKLNKILWKADFSAFAERGVPVTGRAYQRLRLGPAPVEMRPLLAEMEQEGEIALEQTDFGITVDGIPVIERRPIALVDPTFRWFSQDDLAFLDASIDYYKDMSANKTSDDSHGVAWSTRFDGDPMPYDSALFSDEKPPMAQLLRMAGSKGPFEIVSKDELKAMSALAAPTIPKE